MDRVQRLLEALATWKAESSRHERFAGEFERLIRQIDGEFVGPQLEALLDEAELSFARQREAHARLRSASQALDEVRRLHRQLAELLDPLEIERRGATLH